MYWLFAALALVIVYRAVRVLLAVPQRPNDSPYMRYVFLFSPAEVAFFRVLEDAVGHHYRIFAKTRIADVVDLREGLDPRTHRMAFGRICAKHFDFVLCNPRDLSIVGVIELNDASHLEQERARRDDFVVDICNAIGLPILMVRARGEYSALELRAAIERAFHA